MMVSFLVLVSMGPRDIHPLGLSLQGEVAEQIFPICPDQMK